MILKRIITVSLLALCIAAYLFARIINEDSDVNALIIYVVCLGICGLVYFILSIIIYKKRTPITLNKRIKLIHKFEQENDFITLNDDEIERIAELSMLNDFWAEELERMLKDYESSSSYVDIGEDKDWLRLYLVCFSSLKFEHEPEDQYKIVNQSFDELYAYIKNSEKSYKSNKEIYKACNEGCFTHFDLEKFSLYRSYLEKKGQRISIQINNLVPHPEIHDLVKKYRNNKMINNINENTENINPLIIDLTDGDGEIVKVEIVKQYIEGNRRYVVANDLSNDTDCYILEVIQEEEGDALISVDDQDEFNRITQLIEEAEAEEVNG